MNYLVTHDPGLKCFADPATQDWSAWFIRLGYLFKFVKHLRLTETYQTTMTTVDNRLKYITEAQNSSYIRSKPT